MEQFWTVCLDDEYLEHFASSELARLEAAKLAREHPRKRVIVFHAECIVQVDDMPIKVEECG